MKITKRQLRRIIRESLNEIGPPPDMSDPDWHPNMSQEWERRSQSEERRQDEADLEARLNAVWDKVGADTMDALGGQASWEEIAQEVMASGYSIDPDLVETINLLPFEEQQRLFQRAFGKGRRY